MKRKKNIFFGFYFLLFVFLLSAQNTMEQIGYMEGEHRQARFGWHITSLDFNGDGYDDIVVSSPQYDPVHPNNPYDYIGKLYFYLGGETFDSEVDFTFTGNENYGNIRNYPYNLQDINNDGYEDLGFIIWSDDSLKVHILFGNTQQDTIPDFMMSKPFYEEYDLALVRSLGDINSDGYADVGITYEGHQTNSPTEYYIMHGANENLTPEIFGIWGFGLGTLSGIGDVNNDGYDDFSLGFRIIELPYMDFLNRIYFGSDNIQPDDFLLLWEASAGDYTGLGMPLGDLNNDNYDDFIGRFGLFSDDIWYGDDIISPVHDLEITNGGGGGALDFGLSFGDLNADGFDDFVIGSPDYATNDGIAYLYLGNNNPNNTPDLVLNNHGVNHQWGTGITVGRFNGDEYDDVAISAPMETTTGPNPGYVYVFAGNGELADLVDAYENEIPVPGIIEFIAYPNPFNPNVTFEISFTTEFTEGKEIVIEIFNIKGQKVKELIVPNTQYQKPNTQITWNAINQASGLYFCKLVNVETGKQLAVQKVTLLK